MRSFTDTKGRAWLLEVTLPIAKQVKAITAFNLLNPDFQTILKTLAEDPVCRVDVLYVMCKTQAESLGVSDEEFGRSFDGDVMETAFQTLVDAMIDFFPKSRQVDARKVMDLDRQIREAALTRAAQVVGAIKVEEVVAKMFAASVTNSQESPASAPTTTHSAN